MPKLFSKNCKKAVHHKWKFPFFKNRALCSKVIFSFFFPILKSKIKKRTYFLCPFLENGFEN